MLRLFAYASWAAVMALFVYITVVPILNHVVTVLGNLR